MKMSDKDKDREFKNVYEDYKEGIQIYIPEQKRVIGHKAENIERLMMWKIEKWKKALMSSSRVVSIRSLGFLFLIEAFKLSLT